MIARGCFSGEARQSTLGLFRTHLLGVAERCADRANLIRSIECEALVLRLPISTPFDKHEWKSAVLIFFRFCKHFCACTGLHPHEKEFSNRPSVVYRDR
jgi:hypothetical protein